MKPKFIMMSGLPASGKSTESKKLAKEYNAIIHSSDAIRKELCEDENSQENNNVVFEVLHKRIKDDLKSGKSVIYDATNINYKRRKAFLSELKNIPCEKICYVVATPYDVCLEQNAQRERQVPEYVIHKMYLSYHIPYWYEGWDDIKIIYNNRRYLRKISFVWKNENYDQQNKHHTLSLGDHCFACAELTKGSYNNDIYEAALIHDCGKPFVKDFKNSKGEITEDAHYFQHHCVGAYDSLFYISYGDKLKIAILILWHMQPYFWEKDVECGYKSEEKYMKLWGKELYNDIMILHNADKLAH